jgi:hypothetical protein
LVNVNAADRVGRDAQIEQVRDAVGDDAGLARAGAGQHQQRPTAVDHRRALRRVQLAGIDGHRGLTLRIARPGVNRRRYSIATRDAWIASPSDR